MNEGVGSRRGWHRPAVVSGLAMLSILLLWACGYLYWHFRIQWLIKELQKDPSNDQLTESLTRTRSRAIPHLIREMNSAEHQGDLDRTAWQIQYLEYVVDRSMAKHDSLYPEHEPIIWRLSEKREPSRIKQKCEQVREWWQEESTFYPSPWLFWLGRRTK